MVFQMIAAVLMATAPHPATSGPSIGARFYNQPGAGPADLSVELERCRAITTGPTGGAVTGRRDRTLSPPTDDGFLLRGPVVADTIEDCMVKRGWRVYALTPAQQRSVARRTAASRTHLQARLTGARVPPLGRLVRAAAPTLLRVPAANGAR